MSQLRAFSQLDGEDRVILDSEDLQQLLDVSAHLSPDWPGIILHIEGPALQQWTTGGESDVGEAG